MAEETDKETTLLGWEAPEFLTYIRGWKYYSLLSLLFLAVIAYGIYSRDWFVVGIFIIVAGFILWYQQKEPLTKKYRITQLGVYEDNKFYQYNEIYSYWFLIDKDYKTLNIIFAKKYLPQLTILLNGTDPIAVRNVLSKHIPEENNRTETLLDRLVRLFRL
jgi:hypothetical protein